MVLVLGQSPQTQFLNRTAAHFFPGVREFMVFCPGCKALEMLSFNNGWLMQTRKFNQMGEQVFHDCGTVEPCRVYRPC